MEFLLLDRSFCLVIQFSWTVERFYPSMFGSVKCQKIVETVVVSHSSDILFWSDWQHDTRRSSVSDLEVQKTSKSQHLDPDSGPVIG